VTDNADQFYIRSARIDGQEIDVHVRVRGKNAKDIAQFLGEQIDHVLNQHRDANIRETVVEHGGDPDATYP
jgi:hypothetical protein